MYKVIKINEAVATRTVELENIETGKCIKCFDDSALVSLENFEFMEIGGIYECKITLFGSFVEKETTSSVRIEIEEETFVGERKMIKVRLDKEVYYIPQKNERKVNIGTSLCFEFTRKDLIQVDDVIHDDYV